ncbi:MAG TPA: alpha/beta hydrolase [Pseudolysinimonas sp.]|nr:alpha/beta hydrolase [Pseudolysinimonas sp.]
MPTVERQHRTFLDAEGVTIHFYVWSPPAPTAVIHLVHGLGEYATRYEELAQTFAAAGFAVYASDSRGHGQTGVEQYGGELSKLGRPGPGGIRATIAGLRQLRQLAADENPGLPIVLLGHSMGSLFGQKILNAHADDYAAAILSGTAYRTLRHMNSGDLNARHAHLGTTGHEWLSRDPAVAAAFAADPLTFDAKAAKLFGLADGLRLLGRPTKLAHDLPLLIIIGSEDPLGGPRSVELLARAYRERGGLSDVTVTVYPEARHELFNELNRAEVIADVVAWIRARLSA